MTLAFREYQKIALAHMAENPRCALWAGMGMGKTSTSLAFLDALWEVEEAGPALVIAPKRVVVETWPAEAKKWGFGLVTPIVGDAAARVRALRAPGLHAINYENIPWLIGHLGAKWPYRTVVADESSKLKGFRLRHGGKRTALLAKVAHRAERWIELTGTPAANGLKDLWGQMWFIDQGARLGRTYTAFTERWFRTGYNGFDLEPLPHAFEEITARCRDVCLTINAADWFDLEEVIVTNVHVELPRAARTLYGTLEKEMFAALQDRNITAVNAAAKSSKLLQLANGAIYLDPLTEDDTRGKLEWKEVHDAKLQALDSIVGEQAGAPLLVAYHFKSDLARLRAAFPAGRTLDDSPGEVERWNAGHTPVLFVHPASAGHGLNLQHGGNAIAFFGNWWNLEERLQVIERIGPVRQAQSGYKRPVFQYNIIARDTVDELVVDRIASKKTVQDALLDYMRRKRK